MPANAQIAGCDDGSLVDTASHKGRADQVCRCRLSGAGFRRV